MYNDTTTAVILTNAHGEITDDADTIKRVKAALKKSFADVTVRRHRMGEESDATTLLISWNETDKITLESERKHLECEIGAMSVSCVNADDQDKPHVAFGVGCWSNSSVGRQIAGSIKPGHRLYAQTCDKAGAFWIGPWKGNGLGRNFPTQSVNYW